VPSVTISGHGTRARPDFAGSWAWQPRGVALRPDRRHPGRARRASSSTDPGGHSLRLRGQRIEVRTDPPEPIEVDGDLLSLAGGAFTATVKPRSLTVLV
jgi:hypothetical protein